VLYPNEVIEDVRTGNDIVSVIASYVPLKQKGVNLFGLCPFHQERTPSFSVSADKQMYYCFGCGAGGNVLTFIIQIEHMNFVDALKFLADRIHYVLPDGENSEEAARQARLREALYALQKKAARFFYDCLLSPEGKAAAAYLDSRRVSIKTRVKYGLGYAPGGRALVEFLRKEGFADELLGLSGLLIPDKRGGYYDRFTGRLMFPILDPAGRVVGFGGRVIGGDGSKYINSSDTPIFDKSRNLYGIHLAKKSKSAELILVEGYMDVISLYQAGFPQAVAALGTAFSQNHAQAVKKHRDGAVVLFDSDEAGTKAALRAIPFLVNAGLTIRVTQVADAKDPDEYIKSFGADAFAGLLAMAKSHTIFQIEQLNKQLNLGILTDRVKFTSEAAKLIARNENAIERDAYIKEVAGVTGISPEAIAMETEKAMSRPVRAPRVRVTETWRGKADKGAIDAKRGLIYLAAADPKISAALKNALKPEEFGDGVYPKLFSIINSMREESKECIPAALISAFEDLEEQKQVSAVFARAEEYPDKTSKAKAINEMFKVLKRSYIDDKIPAADINQLNELVKMKRNVDKLYISI
jgi:DNA primase